MIWPRFTPVGDNHEVLGWWEDNHKPAFAKKWVGSWTSIYTGAAPLPVQLLRSLAREAKIPLWSSQPDVVFASQDCFLLVAISDGPREIRLPQPLFLLNSEKPAANQFHLDLDFGEVCVFAASRGLPNPL